MATQAEPQAATDELDETKAGNAADTDTDGGNDTGDTGDEGSDEPGPYDALAQQMGWVPKDQFTGPPEQWKPAEQFILDGREIQRETAARLRTLQSTVENIGRTNASIVEQEVTRRVSELQQRFDAAVEEGDRDGALQLGTEIATLKARAQVQPPVQASPEAQQFAERNKGWFQKDPLATARAIEITNTLARQGYDHSAQLQAAEQQVKREFPHLFQTSGGGKGPAGVHSPSSRAPARSGNGKKGFADMPKEAQDVARDMAARNVIPNVDAYAENYWQNQKGTA